MNTAPDGTINLAMLQALLKKKEAPELIGSYKNKAQGLFLFGYTTGKAGTENKHELPPPHDSILCFGDLILLASKDPENWKTPVPFKMDEYEAFYTRAFGGFEDLDSEEELEEAELEDLAEDIDDDLEDEAEVEVEGSSQGKSLCSSRGDGGNTTHGDSGRHSAVFSEHDAHHIDGRRSADGASQLDYDRRRGYSSEYIRINAPVYFPKVAESRCHSRFRRD